MPPEYPGVALHNRGTPGNMTDSAADPTDDPTTATTPDTGPETALPGTGDDEPDQDAEPTMTAPPGERPDAGASLAHAPDGSADDPDAADADGRA
jgi:hypothetical protein